MKQAQAEDSEPVTTRDQQPTLQQPLQKRPGPEVRPTNEQVDEIYRLKQELNNLRDEHVHVQGSMGKMAQDLVEAEMQMDSRHMILQQNEAELSAMKKHNELLFTELAEERLHRAKEDEMVSTVDQSATIQVAEMQNKIKTLSTAL